MNNKKARGIFSRGTYRYSLRVPTVWMLPPPFRVRMCAKAKIHPRRSAKDNFQDTPPNLGTISSPTG